jgi:hypothetical protein
VGITPAGTATTLGAVVTTTELDRAVAVAVLGVAMARCGWRGDSPAVVPTRLAAGADEKAADAAGAEAVVEAGVDAAVEAAGLAAMGGAIRGRAWWLCLEPGRS